jgi:TonB family protein
VDEQGRVRQIEIRQHAGNPLPQQALDLAAQWRFEPAVKGGKAVSSTMQIEVGR